MQNKDETKVIIPNDSDALSEVWDEFGMNHLKIHGGTN